MIRINFPTTFVSSNSLSIGLFNTKKSWSGERFDSTIVENRSISDEISEEYNGSCLKINLKILINYPNK